MKTLSTHTQRYLLLSSNTERAEFLSTHGGVNVKRPVTITCMTTMKKHSMEVSAVDTIVVATEDARVVVVDSQVGVRVDLVRI